MCNENTELLCAVQKQVDAVAESISETTIALDEDTDEIKTIMDEAKQLVHQSSEDFLKKVEEIVPTGNFHYSFQTPPPVFGVCIFYVGSAIEDFFNSTNLNRTWR